EKSVAVWSNPSVSGGPPSAREGFTLTPLKFSRRWILFGGRDGSGSDLADTWLLTRVDTDNGSTWTWRPLATLGAPPARRYHAAGPNGSKEAIVVFGGRSGTTSVLNDVWELDLSDPAYPDGKWNPIVPDASQGTPAGRWGHGMDADFICDGGSVEAAIL